MLDPPHGRGRSPRWLVHATVLLGYFGAGFSSIGGLYGSDRPAGGVLGDFHHAAWTSENGLGSVFDIQQGADGYLWLNTSKGIYRFDGVRFQSVDEATLGAAQNRDLDSAFVGRDGGLWLSTQRKGLLLWKNGKLTAFPDRRCTPGSKTEGIVEDLDGSLWIRASAGLSHLRNGACEQAGPSAGYPGGFPKAIQIDHRGSLWVEMQSGAILFRHAGESKFRSAPAELGSAGEYSYFHEAPDGSVWLSDGAGLRRISDTNGTLLAKPNRDKRMNLGSIRDFAFSPDGALWAASDNGIERFDQSAVQRGWAEAGAGRAFTRHLGLSSEAILKVAVDQEGSVWAGTNSGLDQFRKTPLTTVPLPLNFKREYQFAIAPGDGGSIWIGNRAIPLTNATDQGQIRHLSTTLPTISIHRDHTGAIWSSGITGIQGARLWRIRAGAIERVRYPHDDVETAAEIAVDRNGDPWISTFAPNVYHLVAGSWQQENATLGRKPGVIGTMNEDASGNVWFAFSNNLVEWDGAVFHRYSFSDGQIGISVTTLAFRKERVWMGGLGGVVLFRNGQFRRLNWKNSEFPGPISGIVETGDGGLWTNGFTGIFHVSSAEMAQWLRDPAYRVSGERLDAQDGLAGLVSDRWPEPSLVESASGRLWFATSKGVAWLDPQAYARNRNLRPPPVDVTAVIGDGSERSPWSVLRFAPHTKNVEIDYTALSLAVPGRVRFRYRLEGAEPDWHDAGTRRQAFYNDLSAGPYHFRVTASNNDGVWSETGASVEFIIAPAFYETAWFRWSAAVASASLLWAIGTFRVGALRRQLELRFAERLNERERIARELHDTLLQSLLGLILQFQFAANNISEEHPARKPLERALDRADAVMREGRGRVKDLRGANAGAPGIADQLTATAAQFEPLSSAKFQLSVQGRSRVLRAAIQEEALMIAREALVNAFTHANASVISLEIYFLNSGLRISVMDDGRGIEEQVLQTGGRQEHWGLPGMFERARKIHATLNINRLVQGGTRVQL